MKAEHSTAPVGTESANTQRLKDNSYRLTTHASPRRKLGRGIRNINQCCPNLITLSDQFSI